jgi:hypothetical protein
MSYWQNPEQNLGTMKAGSAKKIVFKGLDTIPNIKSIDPYCGCTAVDFNKETKELIISYSNSLIPAQVQGSQVINKKIDITYEDDTKETLSINAIRIR